MEEYKLTKKKKHLLKGEKFFIIFNILVILGIIGIYAYRTVYYYKIEHDNNDDATLKEKITKINNIVYQNDGLYYINDTYYFKGVNVDNYVYYSGRMFRIIEINNGIKMIEDETSTNIIWGLNNNYQESTVYNFLKDYQDTLKDNEIYLNKVKWCNEKIDVSNYSCNNYFDNYIGLISTKEYLNAGGSNSYLNNKTYFWTINYGDENAYFVNEEGNINNVTHDKDNYYSYGVRAVINLKEDIMYVGGSGKVDDPYIIEQGMGALLKDNSVGNYVNYYGNNYRIIDIQDDGVLLMMDGLLKNQENYRNALKYLNNTFIKELNKNDLVIIKDSYNYYNFDNKYNYQKKTNSSDNYVVLPKIGDIFLNEYQNFWLNTVENTKLGLYYTLTDNKTFFADLDSSFHYLRPIIKIKGNMVVSDGIGTRDNPLKIGDGNEKKE